MSEYRLQVLRVRDYLSATSANMREAIAEISLLPDTKENEAIHKLACEIEVSIRALEGRAVRSNPDAFKE